MSHGDLFLNILRNLPNWIGWILLFISGAVRPCLRTSPHYKIPKMHAIQPTDMGTPLFLEFKKQASGYLKEKLRFARLALTDVTPAEILAEEATDESARGPDARTMKTLSRAAFEVDDYWRIMDVVHRRLSTFDERRWMESYKALALLEFLLTHGPASVAEEFQADKCAIRRWGCLGYVDERGFNWGLATKRKSEKVLQLLEKGQLLHDERELARKLTRGIEGFGSHREELADDRDVAATANSHCDVEVEELLGDEKVQKFQQVNAHASEELQPLIGNTNSGNQMECCVDESRPLFCC